MKKLRDVPEVLAVLESAAEDKELLIARDAAMDAREDALASTLEEMHCWVTLVREAREKVRAEGLEPQTLWVEGGTGVWKWAAATPLREWRPDDCLTQPYPGGLVLGDGPRAVALAFQTLGKATCWTWWRKFLRIKTQRALVGALARVLGLRGPIGWGKGKFLLLIAQR
jgi:hypothetical protein